MSEEADPHRWAWSLIGRLFREFKASIADLGKLGLAPMQGHAIALLEPGAAVPMSRLAEQLQCDNSNVTGIVDRLEAAGLVKRQPFEGDRRVKAVALTPLGEQVRAKVLERLSQPPPTLAALSENDARALGEILLRGFAATER